MNFRNKIIWITGASSGIGEALALTWAKHGIRLIISGRKKAKLNEVRDKCIQKGSDCLVAVLDLADPVSIKKAAEEVKKHYSSIDILINNGGISQRSLASETPVEVDRLIMETNFFGAVALTKEVLPSMISNKQGHVVVVSSVVGKFGFPLRTAYSASKHALQGYFDSLRAELKDENIRITIVSPGRIKTNISINAIDSKGEKHGIMDPGQVKGIPAEKCAEKIIQAVARGKKDLIIARSERIMIMIRKYFPQLYYITASKIRTT